jgi:hypothetical protein
MIDCSVVAMTNAVTADVAMLADVDGAGWGR